MKKALQYTFLIAFILLSSITFTQAQTPPHPGQNAGGSPSLTGPRIGEGAPIENGAFILLALAVGYAARKFYEQRKHNAEEIK